MKAPIKLTELALVAWLAVLPAGAGTITGKVHAEGKPEAEQAATAGGNYSSHALKFAERVDYAAMRDFVVYIEGPMTNVRPVASTAPLQVATITNITQKNAFFTPHVLPVMVGTTVEWPNKDEIYHNVFSYSEAKSFDLGLYKDGEGKTNRVNFDKVGRVDVFCSIHSTMNCVVLVLENPCFAATNPKNGAYTITNVPAGTYKLKAWHERMPPQVREITVPENGEVKADFTLGITGLQKY